MKLKQSLLYLAMAGIPFATAVAADWPISEADNAVTTVNQSISIDVLANDTGEGLVLTKVNDWSVNGGRASINEDGTSVTFVPGTDFQGSDTFWYDFQDNQGRTNAAQVTVRIEGDVTEQPEAWPTATEDFIHIKTAQPNYIISSDSYIPIDVLANDIGVGLSITSVNEWTQNGNIVRLSDDKKSVTFRAFVSQNSWPMVDEFWYVFEDSWGRSNAGKVKVLLSTEDKPDAWPTASGDTAETTVNTSAIIDVLANDAGIGLSLKSVNTSSVRWGTVAITNGKLSYTPYADFEGVDEFWYVFEDAWGRTNSAKVVVNVGATTPVAQVPLNDTGLTVCGDYAYDNSVNHQNDLTTCTAETDSEGDAIPQGQDAVSGRDATANDDSDGHAGFSFTKLDASGSPLAASAQSWSCVKDNVSGLVWESKKGLGNGTAAAGAHSADDTFTWYSTDPSKNGSAGNGTIRSIYSPNSCSGFDVNDTSTYCNTEAFVARVNAESLCGLTDWQMPTVHELSSLLNFNDNSRTIDSTFFPHTTYGTYSTETLSARSPAYAMVIAFYDGHIHTNLKSSSLAVRLVSKSTTASEE
ncbi:Ig-like domain-containing protein [Leucothrix arctica]|uniref:Lcl C-terminal domain-containing protein n=1 Tax=Leucothrix arctica TaxID=1481894 RepID=A0A317C9P4_9GAMM|nr:DUF1566 domain-containing protein [Leucothrix arctica]PWQ95258.1 hypothetical protein DKT75_13015 [Leucothrix arctica]